MDKPPNPWSEKPAKGDPRGRRLGIRIAVFLSVLTVLVLGLNWRFPQALDGGGAWASLGYMVLVLALVSFGFSRRRERLATLARQAGIWLALALIIGVFYAYRFELGAIKDRLMGELIPGMGQETGDGEIRFRVSAGGHFQLEALVNGVPVTFLLDTGASDIVLDPGDAVRLGFNLDRLAFTRRYQTANGVVKGAPVVLALVQIGPVKMRNVSASVNGAPLGVSLLGMSFLGRLSGYTVENGTLILRR